MNVTRRSFVLLVASVIVFAATAGAQPPHPTPQPRDAVGAEAPYDPATEVTLRGTVQDVKQMNRVVTVTHLLVRTPDHATVEVHLGPSVWVARQRVSFQAGDQVEVVGSRVKYAGSEVVVARQVRKAGQTLTLRDTQGVSRWSRGQ